jgi:DNA (cytosine-5)-methyltransferase 1
MADSNKPHLLDLFCCAGGAAMGYHKAGFEVIGCDIKDQPNYPFKFVKGDWKDVLNEYKDWADCFHASPPCQDYSRTKSLHENEYPALIKEVRDAFKETGKPYIIENVLGAPMENVIILDGIMFGLKVVRRRKFESNILLMMPGKGLKRGSVGAKNCTHKDFDGYYIVGGHQMGTLEEWKQAMGIDWNIAREELAEAIPPAYTFFLGEQLMSAIKMDNQKCNTKY